MEDIVYIQNKLEAKSTADASPEDEMVLEALPSQESEQESEELLSEEVRYELLTTEERDFFEELSFYTR